MSTAGDNMEKARQLHGKGFKDWGPPKAPSSVPRLILKAKLYCPHCGARHVEQEGGDPKMKWERRAHTTHRCRSCEGDFDVYVAGASDEELNERNGG